MPECEHRLGSYSNMFSLNGLELYIHSYVPVKFSSLTVTHALEVDSLYTKQENFHLIIDSIVREFKGIKEKKCSSEYILGHSAQSF